MRRFGPTPTRASGSAGSGSSRNSSRNARAFRKIAEEIRAAGFKQAVLLGMGGSSLCVEVLKLTFGKISGYPEVLVLDSTDPAQIKALESKLDLAKTIFIVSSKSGSTLEPNIFKQYFFERVRQVVGRGRGRKTLHRRHRSRLQHAESRRGQRLSSYLFRSCLRSADAIRRFRISARFRARFRESTSGSFSTARRKWFARAALPCPPIRIPA